jgi:multiple antibiotic resistance protein
MSDIVNAFLLVFVGLFPIVNPLGSAPIFLNLTAHCSQQERNRLSWRIAVNGFCLLLGSLFFGSAILEFFGITVPVVRVAGGLVVTSMAWRILNADDGAPERKTLSEKPPRNPDSFYPLTLPLTVGPGSISVAITIGSHRPAGEAMVHTLLLAGAAVAGLLAVAATIYGAYRFAAPLARFLGQGGINVLVRLSAFILMCIGIEIAWSGLRVLLASLGHLPDPG